MPTALTFTSLQSDVRAYLERGSITDETVYNQIPRLINLAERRLARELKVQGFITAVNSAMVDGTCVIEKPDRWRETISINLGAGATYAQRSALFPRSYEYLRMYWPDDTVTAEPKFYADYDYRHWIVAPTPDLAYPFEVVYYELPAMLDDQNTANWVTEFAPNALLYATLLEATPFLKDDERIGTWQSMYDRSISALNGEDLHKVMDRTVARTGA
jgi:hypothetical protein